MRHGLVIALAPVLLAVGCYSTVRYVEVADDDSQLRDKILAEIPLGTSLDRAQQIMEASAYTCAVVADESSYPKTVLYCESEGLGTVSPYARRDRRLALLFVNDLLVDVLASEELRIVDESGESN